MVKIISETNLSFGNVKNKKSYYKKMKLYIKSVKAQMLIGMPVVDLLDKMKTNEMARINASVDKPQ